MSAAQSCCNPCPEIQATSIPGVEGAPGSDGAAGQPGSSAFTLTTADFAVPAVAADVSVTVADNSWMSVGQNVFVEGPANFTVTSKAGTTAVVLNFLGYIGDVAPGTNIPAGSQISPGGIQGSTVADPLPLANGGTGGATRTAAASGLGLGQNATNTSNETPAYTITNSYATVTGMTAVVPATGRYLLMARITARYTGVTFASSRLLSIRLRDTTSNVTLAETIKETGIQTTATFPDLDYVVPLKTASLTAADVVALQCQFDTVPSAGTAVVVTASMILVPLSLS